MLSFWSALVGWVVDVQVLACGLLFATVPLAMLLRQPARRLAVLRPTLVGLAALGVLSAVPGWSLIHLRTEPPALAVVAAPAPPPAAELAPPLGPSLALPANTPRFAPPAQAAVTDLAPTPRSGDASDRVPGWASLVAGAFALGSLGVLLWQTAGGWQTRSIVRRAAPAPTELVKLLESMVAPAVAPRLLISREIAVAAAVGVRRPTVLIPSAMLGDDGVAPTDPRDLAAALAHEWAHVHNGDLRTLAASRWLLALAWPQPLFWLLRRLVRLDQETLADAAAADRTSRTDYAERLVAWARRAATAPSSPRLAAAAGLWERPSQLKRRVALLLDEQFAVLRECSRRWRLSWHVAAAIGAIGLSTMTLEPGAAENAVGPVGRNDAHDSNSTSDLGASSLSLSPYLGGGISERDDAEPNAVKATCLDESGRPVAGARVVVVLSKPIRGPQELLHEGTTDADGNFEWRNVVPIERRQAVLSRAEHEGDLYGIAISFPGRASRELGVHERYLLEHGQAKTFTMPPAVSLRGVVTDEAGRPIAGAIVARELRMVRQAGIHTATTDDQGRFEIADLAPSDPDEMSRQAARANEQSQSKRQENGNDFSLTIGDASLRVRVTHPDFASKMLSGLKAPGEVNLKLAPDGKLVGRVVRSTGEPVAGAPVRASRSLAMKEREGLPPYPDWSGFDFADDYEAETIADNDGNYRFDGLPAGPYDVWVDSAELPNAGLARVAVTAGETTETLPLKVEPGEQIEVRFVDEEGKSLASYRDASLTSGLRASVYVQPFHTLSRRQAQPQRIELGDGGVAVVRGLQGKSMVFVSYLETDDGVPRYGNLPGRSQSIPTKVVDVTPGETTKVEFQVSINSDDASVSGGSVQEAGETNSTDDVQEVPASTAELAYPLQAVASDFYRASRSEPNVVAGLCVDEAGRPVAGVEVSLYLYSSSIGGGDQQPAERIAVTTTGEDGRYRFENVVDAAKNYPQGVPAEHFQASPIKLVAMLARQPGRATAWDNQAAVQILNQGHLGVTTLRPAATLRGRIVDRAGRPIAGAGVTTNRFLRIPGVSLAAATTDDQGRFELQEIEPYDQEAERTKFADWVATLRAKLPPDDFRALELTQAGDVYFPVQPGGGPQFQPLQVYVSHPRYVPAVATVARVPGEVEATLSPGATITGRVVRPGAAGDEPAAGCVVYVQPAPKPPATGPGSAATTAARIEHVRMSVTTTDAAGTYRVDSLAAGEYVVAVDAGDDWVAAGLDGIVVAAGASTAAPDVRLSKGGVVRVQLVDADTGGPLTFPKPRQGWLHASARNGRVLPLTNGVVEFTSAGVGGRRLAPGRYFVFANLPSDGPTPWPQLTSLVAGQPIDEQPTIDVAEGQTHEIELRMRREEIPQAATGTLTPTLDFHPVDPPSDGSK
ncbi:MAG: carboxypeptidase regulatory-like domain-containing protein [Pirellulales bacterium]|nr:carboxypeptidase regulatory-like domain-containing protein [Pirellulales bacterium]